MIGDQRAKRPRGSVAPSRRPAIGGIFVARTAGISAETSVTPKTDDQPEHDARGRERRRGRRQAEPDRVEERIDAERDQEPGEDADDRADQPR